ncbi:uridine kinase [Acholeplasma granularum]|uniref:uridine kinase n=1 Tax=Acholeplasma granularum TaxID=264635 RepID=UPI00047290DC|nr:uridine kinase [Acholeplasma granularum]
MKKPFFMIVAGGSASGKSTVVKSILKKSGIQNVLVINQDDYYLDQKDIPMSERIKMNYDSPESVDIELLKNDLNQLLQGKSIEKPIYDYNLYTRSEKKEIIEPKPIIILEGILSLTDQNIRDLADLKLYVELDDDLRFIRRLTRDVKDRGRSMNSVIEQYLKTVKPMYHLYVKPTKRHADMIIPNDEKHSTAVDVIVNMLKTIKE